MAVSALLWDAALASPTTLHSTSLNALATDTLSAASAAFDNSVALKTHFWLEFVTGTITAPAAGESVDIYAVTSLDGTNYSTAPLTGGAQDDDKFITSFYYKALTTAKRFTHGPFLLEPIKYKFYVDNRLSQSLTATLNTLKIWTGSLENQ